jgi:hypothetical protein
MNDFDPISPINLTEIYSDIWGQLDSSESNLSITGFDFKQIKNLRNLGLATFYSLISQNRFKIDSTPVNLFLEKKSLHIEKLNSINSSLNLSTSQLSSFSNYFDVTDSSTQIHTYFEISTDSFPIESNEVHCLVAFPNAIRSEFDSNKFLLNPKLSIEGTASISIRSVANLNPKPITVTSKSFLAADSNDEEELNLFNLSKNYISPLSSKYIEEKLHLYNILFAPSFNGKINGQFNINNWLNYFPFPSTDEIQAAINSNENTDSRYLVQRNIESFTVTTVSSAYKSLFFKELRVLNPNFTYQDLDKFLEAINNSKPTKIVVYRFFDRVYTYDSIKNMNSWEFVKTIFSTMNLEEFRMFFVFYNLISKTRNTNILNSLKSSSFYKLYLIVSQLDIPRILLDIVPGYEFSSINEGSQVETFKEQLVNFVDNQNTILVLHCYASKFNRTKDRSYIDTSVYAVLDSPILQLLDSDIQISTIKDFEFKFFNKKEYLENSFLKNNRSHISICLNLDNISSTNLLNASSEEYNFSFTQKSIDKLFATLKFNSADSSTVVYDNNYYNKTFSGSFKNKIDDLFNRNLSFKEKTDAFFFENSEELNTPDQVSSFNLGFGYPSQMITLNNRIVSNLIVLEDHLYKLVASKIDLSYLDSYFNLNENTVSSYQNHFMSTMASHLPFTPVDYISTIEIITKLIVDSIVSSGALDNDSYIDCIFNNNRDYEQYILDLSELKSVSPKPIYIVRSDLSWTKQLLNTITSYYELAFKAYTNDLDSLQYLLPDRAFLNLWFSCVNIQNPVHSADLVSIWTNLTSNYSLNKNSFNIYYSSKSQDYFYLKEDGGYGSVKVNLGSANPNQTFKKSYNNYNSKFYVPSYAISSDSFVSKFYKNPFNAINCVNWNLDNKYDYLVTTPHVMGFVSPITVDSRYSETAKLASINSYNRSYEKAALLSSDVLQKLSLSKSVELSNSSESKTKVNTPEIVSLNSGLMAIDIEQKDGHSAFTLADSIDAESQDTNYSFFSYIKSLDDNQLDYLEKTLSSFVSKTESTIYKAYDSSFLINNPLAIPILNLWTIYLSITLDISFSSVNTFKEFVKDKIASKEDQTQTAITRETISFIVSKIEKFTYSTAYFSSKEEFIVSFLTDFLFLYLSNNNKAISTFAYITSLEVPEDSFFEQLQYMLEARDYFVENINPTTSIRQSQLNKYSLIFLLSKDSTSVFNTLIVDTLRSLNSNIDHKLAPLSAVDNWLFILDKPKQAEFLNKLESLTPSFDESKNIYKKSSLIKQGLLPLSIWPVNYKKSSKTAPSKVEFFFYEKSELNVWSSENFTQFWSSSILPASFSDTEEYRVITAPITGKYIKDFAAINLLDSDFFNVIKTSIENSVLNRRSRSDIKEIAFITQAIKLAIKYNPYIDKETLSKKLELKPADVSILDIKNTTIDFLAKELWTSPQIQDIQTYIDGLEKEQSLWFSTFFDPIKGSKSINETENLETYLNLRNYRSRLAASLPYGALSLWTYNHWIKGSQADCAEAQSRVFPLLSHKDGHNPVIDFLPRVFFPGLFISKIAAGCELIPFLAGNTHHTSWLGINKPELNFKNSNIYSLLNRSALRIANIQSDELPTPLPSSIRLRSFTYNNSYYNGTSPSLRSFPEVSLDSTSDLVLNANSPDSIDPDKLFTAIHDTLVANNFYDNLASYSYYLEEFIVLNRDLIQDLFTNKDILNKLLDKAKTFNLSLDEAFKLMEIELVKASSILDFNLLSITSYLNSFVSTKDNSSLEFINTFKFTTGYSKDTVQKNRFFSHFNVKDFYDTSGHKLKYPSKFDDYLYSSLYAKTAIFYDSFRSFLIENLSSIRSEISKPGFSDFMNLEFKHKFSIYMSEIFFKEYGKYKDVFKSCIGTGLSDKIINQTNFASYYKFLSQKEKNSLKTYINSGLVNSDILDNHPVSLYLLLSCNLSVKRLNNKKINIFDGLKIEAEKIPKWIINLITGSLTGDKVTLGSLALRKRFFIYFKSMWGNTNTFMWILDQDPKIFSSLNEKQIYNLMLFCNAMESYNIPENIFQFASSNLPSANTKFFNIPISQLSTPENNFENLLRPKSLELKSIDLASIFNFKAKPEYVPYKDILNTFSLTRTFSYTPTYLYNNGQTISPCFTIDSLMFSLGVYNRTGFSYVDSSQSENRYFYLLGNPHNYINNGDSFYNHRSFEQVACNWPLYYIFNNSPAANILNLNRAEIATSPMFTVDTKVNLLVKTALSDQEMFNKDYGYLSKNNNGLIYSLFEKYKSEEKDEKKLNFNLKKLYMVFREFVVNYFSDLNDTEATIISTSIIEPTATPIDEKSIGAVRLSDSASSSFAGIKTSVNNPVNPRYSECFSHAAFLFGAYTGLTPTSNLLNFISFIEQLNIWFKEEGEVLNARYHYDTSRNLTPRNKLWENFTLSDKLNHLEQHFIAMSDDSSIDSIVYYNAGTNNDWNISNPAYQFSKSRDDLNFNIWPLISYCHLVYNAKDSNIENLGLKRKTIDKQVDYRTPFLSSILKNIATYSWAETNINNDSGVKGSKATYFPGIVTTPTTASDFASVFYRNIGLLRSSLMWTGGNEINSPLNQQMNSPSNQKKTSVRSSIPNIGNNEVYSSNIATVTHLFDVLFPSVDKHKAYKDTNFYQEDLMFKNNWFRNALDYKQTDKEDILIFLMDSAAAVIESSLDSYTTECKGDWKDYCTTSIVTPGSVVCNSLSWFAGNSFATMNGVHINSETTPSCYTLNGSSKSISSSIGYYHFLNPNYKFKYYSLGTGDATLESTSSAAKLTFPGAIFNNGQLENPYIVERNQDAAPYNNRHRFAFSVNYNKENNLLRTYRAATEAIVGCLDNLDNPDEAINILNPDKNFAVFGLTNNNCFLDQSTISFVSSSLIDNLDDVRSFSYSNAVTSVSENEKLNLPISSMLPRYFSYPGKIDTDSKVSNYLYAGSLLKDTTSIPFLNLAIDRAAYIAKQQTYKTVLLDLKGASFVATYDEQSLRQRFENKVCWGHQSNLAKFNNPIYKNFLNPASISTHLFNPYLSIESHAPTSIKFPFLSPSSICLDPNILMLHPEHYGTSWHDEDHPASKEFYNKDFSLSGYKAQVSVAGLFSAGIWFKSSSKIDSVDYKISESKEFTYPYNFAKETSNYSFTLMLNSEDLTKEGKKMNHCVGGYTSNCRRGEVIMHLMPRATFTDKSMEGTLQLVPVTEAGVSYLIEETVNKVDENNNPYEVKRIYRKSLWNENGINLSSNARVIETTALPSVVAYRSNQFRSYRNSSVHSETVKESNTYVTKLNEYVKGYHQLFEWLILMAKPSDNFLCSENSDSDPESKDKSQLVYLYKNKITDYFDHEI